MLPHCLAQMDSTRATLVKVRAQYAQKAPIARAQLYIPRHAGLVSMLLSQEEALVRHVRLGMRARWQLLGQSRAGEPNIQQLARPNVLLARLAMNASTSRARLPVLLASIPSTRLLVLWQAAAQQSPLGKMKANITARSVQPAASANTAIWHQYHAHRGTTRCLEQRSV